MSSFQPFQEGRQLCALISDAQADFASERKQTFGVHLVPPSNWRLARSRQSCRSIFEFTILDSLSAARDLGVLRAAARVTLWGTLAMGGITAIGMIFGVSAR